MEEVVAKSVRKPYLIIYSISLACSFISVLFGALFALMINDQESVFTGCIFIVTGLLLGVFFALWLVYFGKMPGAAIKFKEGKLYFRNGIVCSPTEVDSFKSKTMWLDSGMFDIGKLIISVNGKEFKLKYIDQPEKVVNRLYMLKAEYSVKEHLAKQQNTDGQSVHIEENKQEENNG